MGRRPKFEDDKKKNITMSFRGSIIKDLRTISNYNQKVEDLIKKYLLDKKEE